MNRRQFLKTAGLAGLFVPSLAAAFSTRQAMSSLYGERETNPLADIPDIATGRGLTLDTPVEPLQPSGSIVLGPSDTKVTISGKHFKNILGDGSYAIHIQGGSGRQPLDIEITDCLFENVRWAIRVDNAANIHIHGNRFVNCGQAIRVSESSSIRIDHNEFTNIGGIEVLNHGYGAYWAQNAVALINVTGPDNSVSWNIVDNSHANAPYLEDCISFWNSGGVSDSWAVIEGNQLRGNLPGSSTGTAIIVGDAVGATTLYAGYVRILNNTCVRMQSIGIGVAGGHDYELRGNRIYQPQAHTQGLRKHPYNREDNPLPGGGITVFDYSHTLACRAMTIAGNAAFAVRADGEANPFWVDSSSCFEVREENNAWYWDTADSGDLSDSLLPEDLFSNLSGSYFSGKRSA